MPSAPAADLISRGGLSPDYSAALDDMKKNGAEGLLVLEVPMPFRDGKLVAELATAPGLPTIFPGGQSGVGSLIAYGTTVTDTWPRMPAALPAWHLEDLVGEDRSRPFRDVSSSSISGQRALLDWLFPMKS